MLRRVLNNTALSLASQLITWTSTLLLMAAYGRYLGATKFGELYFAVTFAALVGFPVDLGFNQQIIRDVAQAPEKAQRYLTAALVLKSALWFPLYGAMLAVASALGYSTEQRALIAICGLVLWSSALSSAFGAIHSGHHRSGLAAIATVVEKGLGAAVAILLLREGAGVEAMAVVLLGGSLAGLAWQAFWYGRLVGITPHWDSAVARGLVRAGVPFLAYGVLGVLYYRIDTVMLSLMTNVEVVGWYGASYRLFDTLTFVPALIVSATIAPVMAKYSISNVQHLRVAIDKSMMVMILIIFPVATGMIVAAPNIIGFLYHRADFTPAVPVLQALAPGLVALYLNSVLATILISTGNERKLPIMAGIALVFNVTANLLLIPRYAQTGAALVTSLTEGLLLVLGVLFVRRGLLPSVWRVVVRTAVASALVGAVAFELRSASILVIVPVAAVVYVVAIGIMRIVPKEDMAMFSAALSGRMVGSHAGADVPDHPQVVDSAPVIETDEQRKDAPMAPMGDQPSDHQNMVGGRFSPWRAKLKRIAHATVRYLTNRVINHTPVHAVRYLWYRRVLRWRLGAQSSILMGQRIYAGSLRKGGESVSIGAHTIINQDCLLYTKGGLHIGENVSVSAEACFMTGSHLMDDPDFIDIYRPIVVDDYAWIGCRATILGGVTIGRGAVVMAGAVVSRDVDPFTVVGGVPARPVAKRQLTDPRYQLEYRPLFE